MKKILFLFLVLSSQIFAQNNLAAVKFDEFDDSTDSYSSMKETSLSERLQRFVKQVKKERGKRVYIIYYVARKVKSFEENKISYWADIAKYEITSNTRLQDEEVIIINGGFREKNTLEYWIAPKKSAAPELTPTFSKSESFTCPGIYVNQDGMEFDKTNPVYFRVSVYPKVGETYEWKVSSGRIIEGQGSDFIKVNLSNTDSNRVTAFVEVGGLPLPCEKTGLITIEIGKKPYLFDSAARYNFSELSARLDGLMNALGNQPTMTGYIIVYAARKGGIREREMAIRSVQKYFAFRRYDLSRVKIIRGGFREYNTVDSWLVPLGVNAPVPTPSVDSRFIEIPKRTKTRKKS
ncbi:MAG: hypothetical protein ABJA66_01190 [Actinomycetota bacterium]